MQKTSQHLKTYNQRGWRTIIFGTSVFANMTDKNEANHSNHSGACRLRHTSVQGISLRPKRNNNTFLIYKSRAILQAAGKPVVFPQRLRYLSCCPGSEDTMSKLRKMAPEGSEFPKQTERKCQSLYQLSDLLSADIHYSHLSGSQTEFSSRV